jgi:hypothetical protein
MNKLHIITGEKFQSLCHHHISKDEHKKFELQVDNHIDVDKFDFTDFDNDELVYCNSALLNLQKPKLVESKLYEKLEQFKNPFKLVLHNADDEFGQRYLDKLLTIQNLKKIYTRNMNVNHPLVEPIPIGIANSFWKSGNLDIFDEVLNTDIDKKSNFIYANFTKTDGPLRQLRRKKCYEQIIKQNIPFHLTNLEFGDYLRELKKYKYCISPEGNGIDCYRTWEALYMKTIPICKRSILVEEFAKTFPIYIIDDWYDLNCEVLESEYSKFTWDNYRLLDFNNYIKYIGLL